MLGNWSKSIKVLRNIFNKKICDFVNRIRIGNDSKKK